MGAEGEDEDGGRGGIIIEVGHVDAREPSTSNRFPCLHKPTLSLDRLVLEGVAPGASHVLPLWGTASDRVSAFAIRAELHRDSRDLEGRGRRIIGVEGR